MTLSRLVGGVQKISMLHGDFSSFYSLSVDDRMGYSLAAIGDLDGDGLPDLATGAPNDDDGARARVRCWCS